MNISYVLDIILVVMSIIGIVWGIRKGFIGIFLMVTGLIVSVIVSNYLSPSLSEFFSKVGISKPLDEILAYLFVFSVTLLFFYMINLVIKRITDAFWIGTINKILGAIVGGTILFLLVGSFYYLFAKVPLINFKKPLRESYISRYSYKYAKVIFSLSGKEETIDKFIDGKD